MTRNESVGPSILFVSTYPPTVCGLATYTVALVRAMVAESALSRTLAVARVLQPGDEPGSPDEEVAVAVSVESPDWPSHIAAVSRAFDVLWLQHEFGIFGEGSGRRVLELCHAVSIPVIATLHTVPADPTTGQTEVLEELGSISRTLVVMSRVARNRLLDAFDIDPAKVVVIPHGTHGLGRAIPRHGQGRTIVTWGLIGPGKGIEWGIEAMAHLRHLSPPPRYLIFGQTHPMVKRRQGEAYRNSLHDRVRGLGLERIVEIRDCHLSIAELAAVLEDADVALLPYDSTDQVTSGVLSEAVAAGLPVVATEFPHAIELLSQGAGVTVPHRDPAAIATALTGYLTDPDKRRIAANLAIGASRDLLWDSVAHQHGRVAERAVLLRSAGHR